ncbi:MAG: hypothetical protein QGH29_00450 [Kiritimatiellia bacterium]|jgi:hypothetical protein|nr:hypothetical protein [Kiritimatiellia bacterium]
MKHKTQCGWYFLGLLVALLVVLPSELRAQKTKSPRKRKAILHMSDGEQREGVIELSRGTDFQLTNLKRADTGENATVEAAKFAGRKHKIYTFNFNVVKEMRFAPHSEQYLKKFKMLNVSFQDEVDENGKSMVKKVRYGLPYPVIKPKCTVVFNSGEVVTGLLQTRVVYLTTVDPDTGFKINTSKVVVKSKYSGKPGQSYEDLVRVKHIQMLDEGTQFARSMPITFNTFDFDSIDTNYVRIKDAGDTKLLAHGVVPEEVLLKANERVVSTNGTPATAEASLIRMTGLTQDTLSKVRVQQEADGTVKVHSTLGENVFLAAQINGKWVAGWPAEGTVRTELFKSVEKEFMKTLDYYNERKLIGIIPKKNGRAILALVRLRRDIPDPEFALAWAMSTRWGDAGSFEMGADGKLLEYYRLSILKYVRDPKTGEMSLEDRGSFCRVRLDLEDETPEVGVSPDLWPVVMKDGKLFVGPKQ